MSELTKFGIDYNNLEKDGKGLYKTNPFFKSLANVMEHPEFRNFFDTYINDWGDVKTVIMFMKLYEQTEKNNLNLTSYQKLAAIKQIIDNSETRKTVVNSIISSERKTIKPRHKQIELSPSNSQSNNMLHTNLI